MFQQTDRHYDTISSILSDFVEGKISKIQNLISPCCSCVLVCLSVKFEHFTHVTDFYKSGVNVIVNLSGTTTNYTLTSYNE